MRKTLIIGANGQIGQLLTQQMLAQNLPVSLLLRHAEQAEDLGEKGAEINIGDLETELPDSAFENCDTVVFAAGSGGKTGADKTILVDLWGACKTIDKAKQHQIKHFIMVSAKDAGNPDAGSAAIKHYNVCKHFADQYLINSHLPYTILRPGKLTDAAATGLISTHRPAEKDKQTIPRADVSTCILHCINHSEAVNQITELYQGDRPIEQALIESVTGRLG